MTRSDPLIVEALGVRVAADLSVTQFPSETLDPIRDGWSRARVADDLNRPADVAVSPAILASQPSPERLAAALSTAVTLAAIDARAGQLVMLHAAGVADPVTGATVALVGPSGRGKTTASRALARHWGYVSDETVGVDPVTLVVSPHPKPLSVKGSRDHEMLGSGPVAGPMSGWDVPMNGRQSRGQQPRAGQPPKLQLGPDESGLLTAPGNCRLARIVLLDRDPDHTGTPDLASVAVPRAVGELAAELSHLRWWDEPLATVAGLLTATGGALRVRYAEAIDLAPLLDEFVAAPRGCVRWWRVPTAADDTDPGDAAAGSWQRRDVAEAIADDDSLAVLLSEGDQTRAVVLDGIGPTIWYETGQPRTTAELVAAVVRQHGTPPSGSAEQLVVEALGSLQQQGILRGHG